MTLARLSRLYKHKGDFEYVGPLYIRVLELRIEVFGLSHYKTLIAKRNLGVLYFSFEHYPKAEMIFFRTLYPISLSSDCITSLLLQYVRIYESFFQNKKTMSEPYYMEKEEVNATDKIYGEFHKRTTSTRYQLAVYYESNQNIRIPCISTGFR